MNKQINTNEMLFTADQSTSLYKTEKEFRQQVSKI